MTSKHMTVLRKRLWRAYLRPDNVEDDFLLCYVRFLFDVHRGA